MPSEAPGTRAKQIAMLRAALLAAKETEAAPKAGKKGEAKAGPDKPPSLEVQTMRDVLAGKLPLLVTAWIDAWGWAVAMVLIVVMMLLLLVQTISVERGRNA